MTLKQLGGYIFDLGFILSWFHTGWMALASTFLEAVGSGLESGTGSFSVKVGNAATIGQYLGELGFVFGFFKFLQPAQALVTQLGAELAAGMGTFGPIRAGSEGLSGTVTANGDGSDTVAFTVAPWA
jgi:hypothetical protein